MVYVIHDKIVKTVLQWCSGNFYRVATGVKTGVVNLVTVGHRLKCFGNGK